MLFQICFTWGKGKLSKHLTSSSMTLFSPVPASSLPGTPVCFGNIVVSDFKMSGGADDM